MKTLNETSARRLRRAAQHSIRSRKNKEQEYNFSNFSDNPDLMKLRDEMVRAYNRTERAIQLAQEIPDSKEIKAKDAIIVMQHTFNDSINLMEEICDVVEKCSFSKRVDEGMNLGDMIAGIIDKKKEQDPDADVEKLEQLRNKAEGTPSLNDFHRDEHGKWVKPGRESDLKLPSFVRGKNATDDRRKLSKEDKFNILYNRGKDELNGFPTAIGKSVKRHNKKNNIGESFKLIEEAYGLLSSIFEVDDVEDRSQEHNKIKRETKDREGNKVDVVSVEDELFPYAGNAKQQFNQKVIAKINDMIEGKATLEDLIQLVRSKTVAKKQG